MKVIKAIVAAGLLLACASAGAQQRRPAANPNGPFKVTVGECTHGRIDVSPAIPAEGKEFPKGTVLHIKATADPGYVFECGYKAMGGRFAYFTEYTSQEFDVTVDGACSVGASFVEPELVKGITRINDIVYAKPGVKELKYDAYIPDGAKKLPGIVIIHGGGWQMNCEDVMLGLARELSRDGKYVVFSIDYRWNGTADGDKEPNTMVVDKNGHVWVLCEGRSWDMDYGESPSLWEIDPMLKTAQRRYEFDGTAQVLKSNLAGDQFYMIYNNEVRRFDLASMSLSETFRITAESGILYYNMAVDPRTGDIYVTDAKNYSMNGTVYRYSNDGVLLNSFEAGIIPSAMLFK